MMARVLTVFVCIAASYGVFGRDIRSLGKRTIECKNLWEPCSVVAHCCGDLQCYRENGFNEGNGYCVTCIDQGQTCQLDSQCCEGYVCQKGGFGYTDGQCDVRLPNGSRCHEDDNCASDHCHKKFLHIYGDCADDH